MNWKSDSVKEMVATIGFVAIILAAAAVDWRLAVGVGGLLLFTTACVGLR